LVVNIVSYDNAGAPGEKTSAQPKCEEWYFTDYPLDDSSECGFSTSAFTVEDAIDNLNKTLRIKKDDVDTRDDMEYIYKMVGKMKKAVSFSLVTPTSDGEI
jgi:hypothetical protein